MWFNLTDEEVGVILNDGPGMKMQALAQRLREWMAEQATAEARYYRDGVPVHDEYREMDYNAVVSFDEDNRGAYVMTWYWVRKEDENDDDE